MGLLAPWFLLGLVALAGPLLAHLRRKRVQRRVAFSAVEFLEVRPPRTARRQWEDVALMALRVLALGLVALAFARPYLRVAPAASGSAAPDAARRMVLLLDTSASMRRGKLFEQAVAKAQATLEPLGASEEVELRSFDRVSRVLLGFEQWRGTPVSERVALARNVLAELKPGWAQTRLDEALLAVLEQHRADAGSASTQIVVVSDFQEGSSLVGLQGVEWPARLGVTCVSVGDEGEGSAERVALHWVPPDPDTAAPEDPLKVQVSAGAEYRSETVPLVLEGTKPVERAVPATPGRTRLASFAAREPFARIRVAESADFAASVWAARLPQKRSLVVVAGATEPADRTGAPYFVFQGLRALGDTRVEALPFSELPPEREGEVAFWIVCGRVDDAVLERVRLSVSRGAGAMFLIGSAEDGPSLSSLVGSAVPVEERAVDGFAVFGAMERGHALFAAFGSPQFSDFTGIKFWKHRKLDVTSGGEVSVLARFEGGDPALLEYTRGRGRVLVWTSDWRPADSQWVLSSRCVPFLSACVEWAGGGKRVFFSGVPGDTFVLPEGTTAVRAADGRAVAFSENSVRIDEPGAYTFEPGGGLAVVNVAPEETRTVPLEAGKLEALGVPVRAADAGQAGDAPHGVSAEVLAIRELEARQGAWRVILAVVFALVLVETLWASKLTKTGKASV